MPEKVVLFLDGGFVKKKLQEQTGTSRHVAGRCLALWWREASHEIYRYWEGRLRKETGSDVLFNEMYGCLRNVYINMRAKANCPCYPVKRTEHDVIREYE